MNCSRKNSLGPLRHVITHGVNEFGGHTETLECGHTILRKRDIVGYTNAFRRRCRHCLSKEDPVNTATPITSINVDRTANRVEYSCDGCGRKMLLFPGKHWCGCNPKSQFQMVPTFVSKMANRAAKSVTEAIRRTKP